MKKDNNSVKITAIIVVGVLVTVFGIIGAVNSVADRQTISATGEATISVVPDVVKIYFNIETTADTSKEAKDENTEITDKVVEALIAEGFERSDIETSNFNVYEEYDWTEDGREFIGYTATHTLTVEFNPEDYPEVGPIVDAGIDNGALLNYISFELSPSLQNEYEAQVLELAGADAQKKAEAMVSGVGGKLGKLVSVSDSSSSYYPWRAYDGIAVMESAAGSVKVDNDDISTPIQVGEKEITGRISVIYEIK